MKFCRDETAELVSSPRLMLILLKSKEVRNMQKSVRGFATH